MPHLHGFIAAISWKRAGKDDPGIGAGDDRLAGLERLAQAVEHLRREFGQFVEEQHAVMGKARLARPHLQAAADQRRHRGRMMRRAERPPVGQRAARQFAGDRLDHRDVEQFARVERRQDRGQTLRQHRLAGAGRPDHQEVVAAGRGDFEGAARHFLAAHLAEIGQAGRIGTPPRPPGGRQLVAAQMVDQRQQAVGGDDVDVVAGPGRFRTAGGRADDAPPLGAWRRWRPAACRRWAASRPSSPSSPSAT